MSGLSILLFVLPFPVLFLIHDLEEVATQHRWMLRHQEQLSQRFPVLRRLVVHLSQLSTAAFGIAALEELLIIVASVCYVLLSGAYAMEIWAALFMTFSFHLVVHVFQAVAVRGYVPGVVSALVFIPYVSYGVYSIWLVLSVPQMVAWAAIGIAFMVINLWLAHRLGMIIASKK